MYPCACISRPICTAGGRWCSPRRCWLCHSTPGASASPAAGGGHDRGQRRQRQRQHRQKWHLAAAFVSTRHQPPPAHHVHVDRCVHECLQRCKQAHHRLCQVMSMSYQSCSRPTMLQWQGFAAGGPCSSRVRFAGQQPAMQCSQVSGRSSHSPQPAAQGWAPAWQRMCRSRRCTGRCWSRCGRRSCGTSTARWQTPFGRTVSADHPAMYVYCRCPACGAWCWALGQAQLFVSDGKPGKVRHEACVCRQRHGVVSCRQHQRAAGSAGCACAGAGTHACRDPGHQHCCSRQAFNPEHCS
jgi:hypothetical protein